MRRGRHAGGLGLGCWISPWRAAVAQGGGCRKWFARSLLCTHNQKANPSLSHDASVTRIGMIGNQGAENWASAPSTFVPKWNASIIKKPLIASRVRSRQRVESVA